MYCTKYLKIEMSRFTLSWERIYSDDKWNQYSSRGEYKDVDFALCFYVMPSINAKIDRNEKVKRIFNRARIHHALMCLP